MNIAAFLLMVFSVATFVSLMAYATCLRKVREAESEDNRMTESGGGGMVIIYPHFPEQFGLWLFGILAAVSFVLAIICATYL